MSAETQQAERRHGLVNQWWRDGKTMKAGGISPACSCVAREEDHRQSKQRKRRRDGAMPSTEEGGGVDKAYGAGRAFSRLRPGAS